MQNHRPARIKPVNKQLVVCCIALVLTSCASVNNRPPPAPSDDSPSTSVDYHERGEASYYAMKYQSRLTASGERFNQAASTAAHRRLPFGTRVRVTNLENRRSVIVRINDRGPFVKGRIIDLSQSAFSSIADTRLGVINVEVEVVD